MAKKVPRYGRTLLVFLLAVVAMYAGLALQGDWKPKLGLDLQGGTRIALEASTTTGENITPEKLREAAAIIDSRVNAYGVAESEVATQGDRNIIIEIPGPPVPEILDTVKQTAQLRFRLVANPNAPGASKVPGEDASVEELLAWSRNPSRAWVKRYNEFTCEQADEQGDNPRKPLLACDDAGTKYLLSPAVIEGTQLTDAGYGIPQNDVQYVVNLSFNDEATNDFATLTRAIVGTNEQFAIVLDKEVLSAPVVTSPITDGNAQISGDFTAETAQSLSNSLKYGALPLTFEAPVVTEEGPTLASDQLSAGLLAGGIGLALVLVYCMVYYRGLGIVVVASLAAAAALTYAAILFLSANAGFTLTLPGIAGLIVGVGITADSFIVLFERIRDEMREGKSVRVAVEDGWNRAVWTCVIADAVSLLAAVVLFIFAIGVVKGFAFALGISTAIDLIVFFLLTKPMVSWLVRFKFFARGHKWSGLSAEHAGIERIGVPRTAAGVSR